MKKAIGILLGTFYMLIATDMFVCIVHCAAAKILGQSSMQTSSQSGMLMNHKEGHCKGNNIKDCSKEHGEYVTKENLKPGIDIQFTHAAVLATTQEKYFYSVLYPSAPVIEWVHEHAPPWKSGKMRSIQFHSLQI